MLNYFKVIWLTAFLLSINVTSPAIAADVSAGSGGSWLSSPYTGHDDMILPIPLIHLEEERLYARGLDAGALV